MFALMTTVLIASLLGSLHCVGMCGPFALLAGCGNGRGFQSAPTAAYSLGRLVSYTMVGVLFGSLGMSLNASGSWVGWQQTATWLAGTAMLLAGGIAVARQVGWRVPLPRLAGPLEGLLQSSIRWGRGLSPLRRAGLLGLASSLMPCGWLYVFALTAAGTGSPLWGGLLMAVFWVGTVPILVGLGLGWGRLSPAVQARVPLTMAILVMLVGVMMLTHRGHVDVRGARLVVPASTEQAQQQIDQVDPQQLPCCAPITSATVGSQK